MFDAHYYKEKLKMFKDCGLNYVPNSFLFMEEIINNMEQLEREADWLANKAQIHCHQCEHDPFPDCIGCMRKAARKAVKND